MSDKFTLGDDEMPWHAVACRQAIEKHDISGVGMRLASHPSDYGCVAFPACVAPLAWQVGGNRNGESLVNTFLKGVVGAAALVGATISTVSAQDYTWTLSLPAWDVAQTRSGSFTTDGLEPFDSGASGSFTLTRTGANAWSIASWNINTTAGTFEFGSNQTEFEQTYISGGDGTAASPGGAFNTQMEFFNADGDHRLTLTWFAAELINAMNSETPGSIVELRPFLTSESEFPVINGARRRLNGGCDLNGFETQDCGEDRPAGWLTLAITNIPEVPPTATPEPASMALFGAGLLGLFAARRRRAA